eukprot:CAMPEP_0196996902 /NCGR_PEP_ID=MMETSP1380-20130617/2681_1 /TAXON_ID=5936 /ORGANISM="Euplotes crassus, Strain CT5" /LENGTH=135 /DNA_ID=CAMNT_0042413017 /DNA_START=417 /DNA_END=825 /DNA_ORIENTATION=+
MAEESEGEKEEKENKKQKPNRRAKSIETQFFMNSPGYVPQRNFMPSMIPQMAGNMPGSSMGTPMPGQMPFMPTPFPYPNQGGFTPYNGFPAQNPYQIGTPDPYTINAMNLIDSFNRSAAFHSLASSPNTKKYAYP